MIYAHQVGEILGLVVNAHKQVGLTKEQILLKTLQLDECSTEEEKDELIAEIEELEEKIEGYRSILINFYGPSGTGKTFSIVDAASKLGIPVIQLESSGFSDTVNISGMPYRRLNEDGSYTLELTKPYYIPEPVLDKDGKYVLRKDGGIMWNYDKLGFHIKNYLKVKRFYKGEINQAPMAIILSDDANKTPLNEVKMAHFPLLNIVDEGVFNGEYTPNFLMLFTGNPETYEYDTNGMFGDRAFANRLVHLKVVTSEESVLEQAKAMKASYKARRVLSQMPSIAMAKEDEESSDWRPAMSSSLRSFAMFCTTIEMFEKNPKERLTMLRGIYGSMAYDIEKLLDEVVEVPTARQLLTNFEDHVETLETLIKVNEQGVINLICDQMMEELSQPMEKLIEINFATESYDDIPQGLENFYQFIKRLPNSKRLELVMSILALKGQNGFVLASYIGRHVELTTLIEQDVENIDGAMN